MPIPQLQIEVNRERARAYGVQPGALNEQLSTLLGGKVLAELREGQRTIDLVLRLPPEWRDSPEKIGELLVETRQTASASRSGSSPTCARRKGRTSSTARTPSAASSSA